MKKNKLLSLLTVFVMIFTLIPVTLGFAAEGVTTTQQTAIDTVVGIGLMSLDTEGNFLSDVQVTRAELATIISTMFNTGDNALVEWKEKFFKELHEEFQTADSFQSSVELFSDVDDTSEYYEAIKTVNDLGIMTGFTDGSFGPEGQLTYEQAIKVMVTMLGYKARADIYGGFPMGYVRMANDLKLLNGLSKTTGTITKGDMATLIFNALDVRMLEIASIGDSIEYTAEGTATFLERFLGMKKLTGRVTDNGFSNFIGSQVAAKDFMTIGGISVRVTDDKSYARGYLGRTVNAYVSDNKGDYTLVYAGLDGLDTVVTIDVKDFKSFVSGKITYQVGESTKTVSFDPYADMIYNGTGISSYNEDTFKFPMGTISVVTPRGAGKADILIVDAYESYYVDYVDYVNKMVYSKKVVNGTYASDTIDLNRDENYFLIVKKADGTAADINEIASDSVISVAEGVNSMTVITSLTKVQKFSINEISTVENTTYVSNGTNKYPIAKKFDVNKLVVGESYTLYADVFGEAVFFKLSSEVADKYTVAVVINSMKTSGLDPVTAIKIMDSNGSVASYEIASKINVSGDTDILLSLNDEKTKTPNEFYDIIKDYHGIVRFTLNADGKINYLEFPIKQKTFGNPDNRLTEIYLPDTDGVTSSNNTYRDLYFDSVSGAVRGWYYKPGQGFAGQILVDRNNSKVFVSPKKPADTASVDEKNTYNQQVIDEEYYQVSGPNENFTDDGKHFVKAYTTTADSKYAQFLINQKTVSKSTIGHDTRTFYVFNRQYQGVDENGDSCTYISYYQGATEKKLALSDKFIGVESIINPGVALTGFTLEKGDIFRLSTDSFGKIETLQIIVDENASNPASNYANNAGNLYNTLGKWHSGYADGTSNPYGVRTDPSSNTNSFYSGGRYWSDGGNGYMRNALYWAVYTRGTNELCLTTQPLGADGEEYELDELGEVFVTDSYILSSVNAITIGTNGVTVKSIPISELKTYELTGNNCDRIFLSSRVGSPSSTYAYVNYSADLGN